MALSSRKPPGSGFVANCAFAPEALAAVSHRNSRGFFVSFSLFVCVLSSVFLVCSHTTLHLSPHTVVASATAAEGGLASSVSERSNYMARFNIPAHHVDLIWTKSGTHSFSKAGINYTWNERKTNIGVYAGYSELYDGSTSQYCTLPEAKVDTQATVGRRVMAAGACPNFGKVIAFTNREGSPRTDLKRWQNEIHAVVMPHSTKGCASEASPGASEVPKAQEGFAMYAGYMTHCPFNSGVYEKDMITDTEYDPTVCSFVTAKNPLRFLDTTTPQQGQTYTPFAFHGNGGYDGYDYAGQTKHVGCPPYSAPRKTSPMKDRSWITDAFECSRLSSCTNHCWPFKSGGHCFRSLPAQFNVETKECRLLGYHTQDYRLPQCAENDTSDASQFYCVRPIKTKETSAYAYVTGHTRPDFETKCPPREPFSGVQWGTTTDGKFCAPLASPEVMDNVTAERCGQLAFERSTSDDSRLQYQNQGYLWTTFISTSCDMTQPSLSCVSSSKGKCLLHRSVPNCFFVNTNAMSFTALSAVDPTIAKAPRPEGILPENKCVDVNCGPHGTCDKTTGKCICKPGYIGDNCETVDKCHNNDCSGHGTCDSKSGQCICQPCFTGSNCETQLKDCCEADSDCGDHGRCQDKTCVCNTCYGGTKCNEKIPDCCASDTDCTTPNTKCNLQTQKCECKEGWKGPDCSIVDRCANVTCPGSQICDPDTGKCGCPDMCMEGDKCDVKKKGCCKDNADCNQPNGYCQMDIRQCKCYEGFQGDYCEESVDRCKGVTCKNGGTCDPATGLCNCGVCNSGPLCEKVTPNCCDSDAACENGGKCNPSTHRCECPPQFGGDNCKDQGEKCKGVKCNTGYCDASTGKCVCDQCHTGDRCGTKVPNCCVTNNDCGGPSHGVCNPTDHTCDCLPGWEGPKCDSQADQCKDVLCHNGAKCDPSTGKCICFTDFGDRNCETCNDEACANGGTCQPNGTCECPEGFTGPKCDGNTTGPLCQGVVCHNGGTCNEDTGKCECQDGFTGPTCDDPLSQFSCEVWCTKPDNVLPEPKCDPERDCKDRCCKAVTACVGQLPAGESDEAQWKKCYTEKMKENEDECCMPKSEIADNMVMFLAMGGVILLAGAGALAYNMMSRGGGQAPGSVDFGEAGGGADVAPEDEEAIEVDLDDFKSHPDDAVDLGPKLESTNWDA
ncbi:egf-like domain-containing [Cystoisospora suis]|uniref:Egf-like domain-containing n=1 Tax=Cystoisospora suis TaxID=483139 RepID=A0A2C6KYA7_9APIC|nr:egf-like domain-containing [Cystoisospora suis]